MRKLWIIKWIVLVSAVITLFTFAVMSLWNWLVPDLFHGPFITYLQALGLLVLVRLLFSGFHKHGRHGCGGGWKNRFGQWREKWEQMTPEEREKMRTLWRQRCGHGWKEPASDMKEPGSKV